MNLRYGYRLHNAYFWPPTAAKYAACGGPSFHDGFDVTFALPVEYSWNYNRLAECI